MGIVDVMPVGPASTAQNDDSSWSFFAAMMLDSRLLPQHSQEQEYNVVVARDTDYVDGYEMVGHGVFTIISMISLIIVSLLLNIRVRNMDLLTLRSLRPIRVLVLSVYVMTIVFLFVDTVIMNGFIPLTTTKACHDSILVCFIFYLGVKGILYLFLVERVHAIRGDRVPRYKDWVWVAGVMIVAIGFGPGAVGSFGYSYGMIVRHTDADDVVNAAIGVECKIGLRNPWLYVDFAVDVWVNLGLTSLFIILLLPALRWRRKQRHQNPDPGPNDMEIGVSSIVSTHWETIEPENSEADTITETRKDKIISSSTTVPTQATDISSSSSANSSSNLGQTTPFDLAYQSTTKFETPTNPMPHLSWQTRLLSRFGITRTKITKKKSEDRLEKLVWRTVLGTFGMLIPTALNLGLFVYYKVEEQTWICMTVCAVDVTVEVSIIHWLTSDGWESDRV